MVHLIKKLSDIIPDIEAGLNYKEIGRKYGRSEPTIQRYVNILRKNGYKFYTKRGRKVPKL